MSTPSSWPLPASGLRLLTPRHILQELKQHPLTRGCYPNALGYYPSAAGHHMRRDRHDDHLLIFCTRGRGELYTARQRHAVSAGDVLLLARGEAHDYHAQDAEPWTLYWAHFDGEASDTLLHYLRGSGGPVLHSGVEPALVGGFASLLETAAGAYRLDAYISASNRLRQLITEFALFRGRPRSQHLGNAELAALQRFMRERIGGQLTLGELAALADLSPQHFAARYRERTGYPPLQHFQQMKIEAACRLLDSTADSVKAIAARLGYSDPLYFSRVFRRTQGMSPTAYRASLQR